MGKKKPSEVGYKSPPKHTQFRPGQSGNPGGLPKGTPKVSVALMRLLAGPADEDFTPKTRGEQIAWVLYRRAVQGDIQAINSLIDRVEGRPKQTINLNASQQEIERYEKMVAALMKKAEDAKHPITRERAINLIAAHDDNILEVIPLASEQTH